LLEDARPGALGPNGHARELAFEQVKLALGTEVEARSPA
jgi:hypothetical protein